MFKKIVFILPAILLFGCSSIPQNSVNTNPSAQSLEILSQESQKAVLAQLSLKTDQAEHLKSLQVKQSKFKVDLLNLNYIGSPQVLLNSIANYFGYRYLENGPSRSLPIVNFTDRKETGFEAVKDIAVFIDEYANITIDNQNKTILLTYLTR